MATLSQSTKPQGINRNTLALAVTTGLLTLALAGCGSDNNNNQHTHNSQQGSEQGNGSGHGHNTGGGKEDTEQKNLFTKTATWQVNYNDASKQPICYDFDSKTEITDCQGNKWDIKFDNQGRGGVKFWTNGGVSGNGNGAASYLMPWSQLKEFNSSTAIPPAGYRIDSGEGIFAQYPWSEYSLLKPHQMAPNYRVYLITTDASDATTNSTPNRPVYALQITDYYNENEKSGYPTIRWIDTALPNKVNETTVDATSTTEWSYLNLTTGEKTTKDGDWHIGFKRYDVILNGGASGHANVGGYLAKTPDGYYTKDKEDKLTPVATAFKAGNAKNTLKYLTQVNEYDISTDGVPWVTDIKGSQLNPEPTGNYPVIDYGWYVYRGDKGHILEAKPEDKAIGTILRSGEGDSYAKMRLESIENGVWTFKFEIQPKTKS